MIPDKIIKPSEEIKNLFNSVRVLANIRTLLKEGLFSGNMARNLDEAQSFLNQLYQNTYKTLEEHPESELYMGKKE